MMAVAGCSKSEGPRPAATPEQASIAPHVTNIIEVEKPRLVTETEIVEIEQDHQEMERRRVQNMTLVDDRKKEEDSSSQQSEGVRR